MPARETSRQKVSKASARALGAAFGVTVGQHRGVHGAGRGPGNAVDLEPRLFEQAIEHAPGEGAMRAAALEREIDEKRDRDLPRFYAAWRRAALALALALHDDALGRQQLAACPSDPIARVWM